MAGLLDRWTGQCERWDPLLAIASSTEYLPLTVLPIRAAPSSRRHQRNPSIKTRLYAGCDYDSLAPARPLLPSFSSPQTRLR